MPCGTIHICIAEKINKKLHKENYPFILGNLAADSWRNNGETSRNKSHFSREGKHKNEDYMAFYNKYKNNLDNPFVFGYLTHLMADDYYRNKVNSVSKTIVNGKKTVIKLDGSPFLPAEKCKWFFGQNTLKLANELTNYFNLSKIDLANINTINNPIEEVSINALSETIKFLNGYELINQIKPNEVFDFNESLNDIENCANFILNELKRLNLM